MRRLLKALRHEAPGPEATCYRLGIEAPAFYAFKVSHGGIGRPAGAGPRARRRRSHEGSDFKSADGEPARLGALFAVQGDKTAKIAEAPAMATSSRSPRSTG